MSTASFFAADGTPLGSQLIGDGQTVLIGPGFAQPVAAIQITPVVRQPEPAPEIPEPAGFRELELSWLQSEGGGHPDAASVEKVSSDGSDWNGDTEGGFYSAFSVDIDWTDAAGEKHFTEPEGEAMDSLWHWVVRAWPQAPEGNQ